MKKIKNCRTYISCLMLSAVAMASAQTAQEAGAPSVVDHITESGKHVIVMSPDLENLLKNTGGDEVQADKKRSTTRLVYRVQVFSDNRGERSKTEGEKKKRIVQRRFPEYPTTLGWDTPYWKVKVGVFSTQAEASEAAAVIRKAFPSFAREIHVVRERMKVNN